MATAIDQLELRRLVRVHRIDETLRTQMKFAPGSTRLYLANVDHRTIAICSDEAPASIEAAFEAVTKTMRELLEQPRSASTPMFLAELTTTPS